MDRSEWASPARVSRHREEKAMTIAKALIEGAKLAALFGAVALVVWSMPEYDAEKIDKENPQIVRFGS
jgi:hypothetical protein